MVARLRHVLPQVAVAALLVGAFGVVVTRGALPGRTETHREAHREIDPATFIAPQVPAALPELTPDVAARYAAMPHPAGSLPILAYHDVGTTGDAALSVSPEMFAHQMAMLRAAGFSPVSIAQLARWTTGAGSLPPNPILITFDDGTRGVWVHAEPVLKHLGWPATAFIITGSVGTHYPYYASWPELRALAETGRWDIEAHTAFGHSRVTTDARGQSGPFLLNRQWLDGGGTNEARLETVGEFRARIDADLLRSADDITAAGFSRPLMFAYPFSATVEPTNDPRLPSITRDAVAEAFPISVVSTWPPRWATDADAASGQLLPRFGIDATTTPDGLFEALRASAPMTVESASGLIGDRTLWTPIDGTQSDQVTTLDRRLIFPRGRGWHAVAFAPVSTRSWRDYILTTTVSGLLGGRRGATGTIIVRNASGTRVEVGVAVRSLTVTLQSASGTTRLARLALVARSEHTVSVTVAGDTLTVRADGGQSRTVAIDEAPYGGPGIGAWRATTAPRATVVFRDVQVHETR